MDNPTSRTPVPPSDVINADDYESGLKVLARIIARVHMRTVANRKVSKNKYLPIK
jgi:hypothetical protein